MEFEFILGLISQLAKSNVQSVRTVLGVQLY